MCHLKKCPFCGNKYNEPVVKSYYNSYVGRQYFVECQYCGATSRHEPTQEYAIEKWNTRTLIEGE